MEGEESLNEGKYYSCYFIRRLWSTEINLSVQKVTSNEAEHS